MSTHSRPRRRTSDSEEEDLVPPKAPEDGRETLPVEQSAVRARNASSSAEATLQEAHGRLLHAATLILAEICPTVSLVKEGAGVLLVDDDSAAISQQAGIPVAQPSSSAVILSPGHLMEWSPFRYAYRLGVEATSVMVGHDRRTSRGDQGRRVVLEAAVSFATIADCQGIELPRTTTVPPSIAAILRFPTP
ncbi:unnamed protein product [Lampetra planeri]